jgi:DNA-binding HxlR family transcriptional regulator
MMASDSSARMQGTSRAEASIGELIRGCQVAQALKFVGDRWSILILRDLFLGQRRFEDLRRRTDAARSTLTNRLNALQQAGIVSKTPYQSSPTRYEYDLTELGTGLYPLALMAWRWEHDWSSTEDSGVPDRLVHRDCGRTMLPELHCRHCRELIAIHDVSFAPAAGSTRVKPPRPYFQRRSRPKSAYDDDVDTRFFHLADVIGDRWTGLVLAAMFFGLSRYDEFKSALGIATNILSHRLKLLCATGIATREPFQQRPTRYCYRLTEKGRALYGPTLMMHQWADESVVDARQRALQLTHRNCGQPLYGIVVCSACSGQLEPGHVILRDHTAGSAG